MIAARVLVWNMRRLLLACLVALSGCAAHLAPEGPPIEAPAQSASVFTMPDGTRLPYRTWLPRARPWAVVLALHGMNDSRDAWELSAPELADAGIAVYAPDQRGFGATAARGYWPGVPTLVSDARTVADLIHARHPDARLYVMGESMGAAVTMCLAASAHPPPAAGYVMLSPAVWGRAELDLFLRATLWLAYHTVPGAKFASAPGLKIHASDNRAAMIRLGRDPLTIHDTRVDAIKGLVDLEDAALAAAPRVHGPALFLYGGHDDLVPKHATRAAWDALRDPRAQTAFYPRGYHLLLRDLERAPRIADVIAWMRDPAAPVPSGADTLARDWLLHALPPGPHPGYDDAHGPVAQMDRASPSEGEGQAFESPRVRQPPLPAP